MSDDEIMETFARSMRTVITATAQIRERAERAAAQRDREAAQRVREGTQLQEQQFKVWVAQQQEGYKRVGWHDWEDRATMQEWADAYTAARGMREVDPRAVAAANRIESEYIRRFGVDLREAWQRFEESETLRAEAASRRSPRETSAETVAETIEDITRETRTEYAGVSKEEWRASATTDDWVYAYGNARAAQHIDPVAKMAVPIIEEEVLKRYGEDIRAQYEHALAALREKEAAKAETARNDTANAEKARDDTADAKDAASEARVDVDRERDAATNGAEASTAVGPDGVRFFVVGATPETSRVAGDKIGNEGSAGDQDSLSDDERVEQGRPLEDGDRASSSDRSPEVTELVGVAHEEEARHATANEKSDPSTLIQHSPDVQRAEAKLSTADREVDRAEEDERKADRTAESSITESRAATRGTQVTEAEVNKADTIVNQGSAGYKPATTQLDARKPGKGASHNQAGKQTDVAKDRLRKRGVGR